jgi:hypothetical protein
MKVKLQTVRLAFPVLFEAKTIAGQGEPKFTAAFLFPKEHPAFAEVNAAIDAVAKEKWKEKAASVLAGLRAEGKICLKNGDAKPDYSGYPGNFFVNCTSAVRPLVIDKNKSPLTAADGKPYGGCYVHAAIEIWAQDNKYGKRVNASLKGVQFAADGDAFGAGAPASSEEFDDLEQTEEALA